MTKTVSPLAPLMRVSGMRKQFGARFDAYAARTPRFLPSFKHQEATA